MSAADFIPVNEPLLDGNEKRYLAECIDSGWISSEGPFVARLEEGMARRTGRRFGVACCNGTAALDLAVAALELSPGDEVILPAFTIVSCVQQVVRSGLVPVFVDADPRTWNMTPAAVAAALSPRTRAIMAVHIYGLPVDMDPILRLAREHGLAVIEDAAQAIGLLYRGRPCGGLGDLSVMSFYPNKHVTTGEGGMVLTDDEALAGRLRSLRNLCFEQPRRFVHRELGFNYRMTNLQAAIGVAQLERLDEFMDRKRALGRRYRAALEGVAGVALAPARTDYAENGHWVLGVVLDDELPFDAAEAMRLLGAAGVGTRPFFFPLHRQPFFAGRFADLPLPVAERLGERGFYLPSGLALTEAQLDRAAAALARLLGHR